MARPLRIEYAGALYHVTSRGDRREAIYGDDEDRALWLDTLAQVCSRFNWRCHAWCSMDNHYHLVIETIEGNLARGMRQLNGVYTQQFNRRHSLQGHLFQGRYKAILVEKESYLLELTRYVVLNPVRAGMVSEAGAWRWSSYGAVVKSVASPPWLETEWLLNQFGSTEPVAINRYKDFVRAGVGLPPVWDGLKRQIYLGSEAFVERMQARHEPDRNQQDWGEIPRSQRRPTARALEWYGDKSISRHAAMAQAYLSGDYTMKEIAAGFKVHYSTVSRAVRKEENTGL